MDLESWTLIFSDFGNQEVRLRPYDLEYRILYGIAETF